MSALAPGLRRALERAGLRALDIALADWGWRHGGGSAGAIGLALASQAVSQGHTCLRLDDTATLSADGDRLMETRAFLDGLADNPLVTTPTADRVAPLVRDGDRLYLQRYWAYECRLAERLRERLATPPADVATEPLAPGGGLFEDDGAASGAANWQAVAAFVAQRHRFAVISGGPGTGKTYSIVRVLVRLIEAALAAGEPPPLVRLAAPTGKAAARMMASIHAGLEALDPPPAVRAHLPADATTLHRLLRLHPHSTCPGHDRDNPLAADAVIVDEASMVDLPLMAKLADALAPAARLILLGDRYQLASVESGAVLADLCEPAGLNAFSAAQRAAAGPLLADDDGPECPGPLADHVVTLRTSHRFHADSAIGQLAAAINAGEADAVADVLGASGDELTAVPASDEATIAGLVATMAETYADLHTATDPTEALMRLEAVRLLTATRIGPTGSVALNARITTELADRHGFDPQARWHHGRPVMVVHNDPRAGLFNGDVGLVWRGPDGAIRAWFRTEDGLRAFHPSVLPAHETVYAMTVHKAQGSEFERVALLLPPAPSPVLTRELLYTAVTRARQHLHAVGDPEAWAAGVRRRVARQSGLAARLIGDTG